MRTLALLVSITLAAVSGFAQGNSELSQIQTVYLMPMANGFDQYLANRLREVPQIRVVADPSKADAVFTDRLGATFENKLEEWADAQKQKQEEANVPPADAAAAPSREGFKFAPKVVSNLSRGRGTYFLVDRRSRIVLWSIYSKAKNSQPNSLNSNAGHVAEKLAKDFTGKKR
jgi:hypothetical protein